MSTYPHPTSTTTSNIMVPHTPSEAMTSSLGLFGVPTSPHTAKILILPVPWDVTTSYGGGSSHGPSAVLEASPQIDLLDLETGDSYKCGYHLLPIEKKWLALNHQLRPMALKIRSEWEQLGQLSVLGEKYLQEVNRGCQDMVDWVYHRSQQILEDQKVVAVLGGDHSSPEGALHAISDVCGGDFGLLHIDAHADLRCAYQGFHHSHASIMYNVMQAPWKPQALVQVGIRDFCQEEFQLIQSRSDIHTFFDLPIKQQLFEGKSWAELCLNIMAPLPEKVYISFDIDGLSPEYCPHTGTPVPGGLSFDQALYLLKTLVHSGRKIIGFDLNEVAPGPSGHQWDGNVGARLLYKLCGWTVVSQGFSPSIIAANPS